ncbi:MAG: hypothetical protein MJY44_06165 [Bacteroidales bacterium]|nr:hypothetical protein [Bacteroidales bacterium]
MLNRRILRIKAFKAVYSIAENVSIPGREILSQLDRSCEATRSLYLFIMALIPALASEAHARLEAARSKFNPTEEERNPNMRFVNNSVAHSLAEDPDFCKILARRKISWEQYDAFLFNLYACVRERDYFKKYMGLPEAGRREDAAIWADILASELPQNRELEQILEDLDIWWNDDLEYAVNCCIATLDRMGEGAVWELPELYRGCGGVSDSKFAAGIVHKACSGFPKYWEKIAEAATKWDRDRICATDLALIVCGLAEKAAFPDTPSKVIINEYVEISKFYSTPESRGFVNGLLDKLIDN